MHLQPDSPLHRHSRRDLLVLAFCAFVIHGGTAAEPPPFDTAFHLLDQAVAEGEVPGAVALVMRHGKVVREAAYGLSDIDKRTPFHTDTLCWLASITKPVTTAAAMKLVESGQLSLDDAVEKYLPEFKDQTGVDGLHHAVKIRQLMSHTSGIQAGPPLRPKFFFEAEWLGRGLAEVVKEIAATQLQFMPGEKVQYSNAAPYVLARIIEILSHRSYHEYVEEVLFKPLGMKDTFFIVPPAEAGRLAVVYRNDKGRRTDFFRFDPTWKITMTMPDGGLFSAARDVAKFVQMFLDNDGTVLAKESVRQMLTPQAPGWGLGWELQGGGVFGHDGSSGTSTWGDPKTGVAGVVFCQMQDKDKVEPLQARVREAVQDER